MKPLASVRTIPSSPRYFAVELGERGTHHFRFPSYGKAAKLLPLLSGLNEGDGVEKLVTMLDVAGYAIGLCWFNSGHDLDAGKPPAIADDGAWQEYGDDVIDEIQEAGFGLQDVMTVVTVLMEQIGSQLAVADEAQEEAPNS